MHATTQSPASIFGQQIRYVVPLYQRPYVWTERRQWAPLWEDVAVVADQVLTQPTGLGDQQTAPHFLGALVLDQMFAPVSHIGARSVVDGQQRLTTLQLLLDAAHDVVTQHGRPVDAAALEVLIGNNSALAVDPDHAFKVWPTDRDQPAFRYAMQGAATPSSDLEHSPVVQAHRFFRRAISTWAQVEDEPSRAGERLAALTIALREKLRLVVIDLEPGDNAQVIFESLNFRGEPLLAADLIKNLMFQVAAGQGLDTDSLYNTHWRELDDDYWRATVATGRRKSPRIDLFMQRWLVMNLRRDVPADRVFLEFRDNFVSKPGADVGKLFAQISKDAQVHKSWDSLPVDSVLGRFHYRIFTALDAQIFAPVFLWLTRLAEHELPVVQRDKALQSIESWLVRRALVGATPKDYNNAVTEMLRHLEAGAPSQAGDRIVDLLAGHSAESRYWPSNERLKNALVDFPIYARLKPVRRLRMVLEALEEATRTVFGEGQPAPRDLSIEHVMPQTWQTHWGSDVVGDPEATEERDLLVQTLGNLTLVTGKLNPALSNRPWTDTQSKLRELGSQGKRSYLLEHSELKLNAELVLHHDFEWTTSAIRRRTDDLIDRICKIWPVDPEAQQPAMVIYASSAPSRRRQDNTAVAASSLASWESDPDSIEASARLWLMLNTTSRQLFQELIARSPAKVAGPVLAALLDLSTGARGVAGALGWPAQAAANLGRVLPINCEEGTPSHYWIEPEVAATLDAGARLATSEAFIAKQVDRPAAQQGNARPRPDTPSTRRPAGSVHQHLRAVFDGLPPGTMLTVNEIAHYSSPHYRSGEISQGAISQAVNVGRASGFEWVPGASPRRIRPI